MTYSSSDLANEITTAMCTRCPSRDEECDDLNAVATCAIRAIRYAMGEE